MDAKPALDKAKAYLRSQLSSRRHGEARLPTTHQLARDAGVSLVTMWKAVRTLVDEKVIEARRGAGIHRLPRSSSHRSSQLTQSIAQKLLHDIVEGRFHNDNALPLIKELASLYETGTIVIRGAIDVLIAQGHVVKRGREFRIRRQRLSGMSVLSVGFISGPDFFDECEIGYFRTTTEQFLNYFERQCTQRNVRLERLTLADMVRFGGHRDDLRQGFVVWITGSMQASMKSLFERLARTGKPVAAYCQLEADFDELADVHPDKVKIFTNDNKAAGRTIGNALLHAGHKRICFIMEKPWPWAQQRFEGVRSAFTEAGNHGNVLLIQGNPLAHAPGKDSHAWRSADSNKQSAGRLIAHADNAHVEEGFRKRLRQRIAELSYGPGLYCVLESSLRKALTLRDVTAWVAADDYIALHAALPFLQSRNARIPRDLSVISFNDQFESGAAGLSSFHFDMVGMAMRMLTFLLYPSLERRLHPGRDACRIEGIGGFIVDRGSIGQA